ncbi:MAG: ferrous iron transport protein [Bacteroidota bacterium]
MPVNTHPKIALIGNPNAGKSSLFNHLTGLNQKIGNFPGVTVDKKTGSCIMVEHVNAEIIDLPGTYSLYPKSQDEQVVFDILTNPQDKNYPDTIIVVADASNLKRNLLLFTEIKDLGIPIVLAINMVDVAKRQGISINIEQLKTKLGVPVVAINARTGEGIDWLKVATLASRVKQSPGFFNTSLFAENVIADLVAQLNISNPYVALLTAHMYEKMSHLSAAEKSIVKNTCQQHGFDSAALQAKETIARYQYLNTLIDEVVVQQNQKTVDTISKKLDQVLTHKVWGYLIFFATLFLIFQAIFAWASIPMEWIDLGISKLNGFLIEALPAGPVVNLLTEGLITGLGGVLIFIPQIAILFAFIAILEESGYMARVMFIMDKLMRKFGLNGKSVVPLVSSVACAVPAIMATRNIDNWKERMITIFVTPLISCSARIPVFTVLIALIVPEQYVLGIFNLQGLALMGLYLIGFLAAIITAKLMQLLLKSKDRSYFVMEMPGYKVPRWKNVGLTIVEKVKAFVFEAGKIIVAISIVLWVLASYGPGNAITEAAEKAKTIAKTQQLSPAQTTNLVASHKLEASYAGTFGKFIEPAIAPLGFDWKIGIALITSFAAREVFIGTMSTIYSIGAEVENENTIVKRMQAEVNPKTGTIMYTPALAMSLLIFYVFAMQCMSTIAVVYRETKSWVWPAIQLVYMTGLAYLSSWMVFALMS